MMKTINNNLKSWCLTLIVTTITGIVFAAAYQPNSASISGGGTTCQNTALMLTASIGGEKCANGGGTFQSTGTITWYSSTDNSNATFGDDISVFSEPFSTNDATTTLWTYNPDVTALGTLYYYYVVTWNNNGQGGTCGAGSLTSSTQTVVVETTGASCLPYCTTDFSNNSFDWISNVSFGPIDEASGGSGGYTDNTGTCYDVIEGSTVQLCVSVTTTGAYTEHIWAFFDFDMDGTFANGAYTEVYDLGDNGGTNGTFQICQDITIPAGALGNYTMRIIEMYNADPPIDGCGPMGQSDGEVEDYCLNVIPCTTTVPDAGIDQILAGCTNITNFTGNVISQGTGTWVQTSGPPAIFDPYDETSPVTIGPGTSTFEWQVTDDPCPALVDAVSITNNNIPTIADAGSDQSACVGSFTMAANAPVGTETGSWSCTGGACGSLAGLPSSNPNQVFTLAGGAGTSATLTWTLTLGACTTTDDIDVLIIAGVTIADAGADQAQVCYSSFGPGSTSLEGNDAGSGETGTWSVISNTTGGVLSDPSDPLSTVTGVNATGSMTLQWTISSPGCVSSTDQITFNSISCNPDIPCFAQPLSVSSGTCSYSTYDNNGMTTATGMPEPGCTTLNGPDIWFSVTVPASGQVQISGQSIGTFDPMISIYDGPCSSPEFSGCVDGGGTDVYPLTYAGTPGSIIYVRVNEGGSGDATNGSFGLCAYEATTATISEVLPGDTTTIACGSSLNFYDPGGLGGTTSTNTSEPPPAGNYSNNTGAQWTICPDDPTQIVSIDFSGFWLENGFDKLIVLSGDIVIGQWTGALTIPDIVTSQNPGECLTVVLQSDYSFTAGGWEAVVSCTDILNVVPPSITNACEVTNCNGECGVWICVDGVYDTQAGAGAGVDEINEVTGGCWGAAGEVATSWFYFTIGADGELAFEFVPSNNGHNINFALYGPSFDGVPPCPLSTGDAPIRCSFASAGGINTGLQVGQTDLYDILNGDGMAAPLDVTSGETYALVVDVYQNGQPPTETEIDFTGTAVLDCSPVLLGITLEDLSGINQGEKNLLNWTISSQINNAYFTLERSMNGVQWEMVGNVTGAGTTLDRMFYSLIDDRPYFPVSYYRLKQTDLDGKFTHSDVIAVSTFKDSSEDFINGLFPNPASDFATFIFSGRDTKTTLNVRVLNETGQVVSEYNYTSLYEGMPATMETFNLATGLYQVEFNQGENRQIQKLAIIK